ncbi:TetR family transcriptional regulator [Nocardia sp. NBC_01503]|uniref:TetR/AcrR family transcriptional regulator n=1 Tax=Nocardia sp. NBC_01503 TaxID=2975997 RepID=UPI002E7AC540|nr:TetR family transcriptional regulator [Nocardia sp. NBC_01503]WTL35346.1 TetR family transcriptional regulator [Nocardia sp. NBC_01503]
MAGREKLNRQRLSRDAVIEAALDLAYRRGIDGLSFRRLADALDVSPMALYWHVENKDELLNAMGDRACRDLRITADPNDPWDRQLRSLVTDFVRMIEKNPGAAPIIIPRVVYSETGREFMERLIGLLRGAGFDIGEATQLARQGARTAMSLVNEPLFTGVTLEPERRAVLLAQAEALHAELPPERYPNILAAWNDLGDITSRESFIQLGIDTYVHGVVGLAAARAATR